MSLAILAAQGREIPVSVTRGVYLLVMNEEIVYVGQSRNIEQRVVGHQHRGLSFDRVIAITTDAVNRRRCDYECALTRAFVPVYNDRIQAPRRSDARLLRVLGIDPAIISQDAIDEHNVRIRAARIRRSRRWANGREKSAARIAEMAAMEVAA